LVLDLLGQGPQPLLELVWVFAKQGQPHRHQVLHRLILGLRGQTVLLHISSKALARAFARFEGLKPLLGPFQGLDRRRNGGLDSALPRFMRLRVFGVFRGEWLGRPDPPLVGLKSFWGWCPTSAFSLQPLAFSI
jgi:hypothetical protein